LDLCFELVETATHPEQKNQFGLRDRLRCGEWNDCEFRLLSGMNYTLRSHVTPPCVIGLGLPVRCKLSGGPFFSLSLRLWLAAPAFAVDFFLCLAEPRNIFLAPESFAYAIDQPRARCSNLPRHYPALKSDSCDSDRLCCFASAIGFLTHIYTCITFILTCQPLCERILA